MTHKTRVLARRNYPNIQDSFNFGGPEIVYGDYPVRLSGFQATDSDNHPFGLHKKLPTLDIGGPFLTQTAEIQSNPTYIDCTGYSGSVGFRRKGWTFANFYQLELNDSHFIQPYNALQMAGFGATGIARALPTNALAGMGQFLAELRDLPRQPGKTLPNLVRSFSHNLDGVRAIKNNAARFKRLQKSIGDEYLNIQFGWVPFYNDLQSFAKVAKNQSKHIEQYARNSGKHVRRGSTVYKDESTEANVITNAWYGSPAVPTYCVASPGTLTYTKKTETFIYFRGAFTYYLPPGDDIIGKARRVEAQASHLYGLRLTPDLLWKVAPWSWAADWVTNIGDVIHNWSAFQNDGLVMHYGYVMAHRVITQTWSGEGLILTNGHNVSCSDTIVQETKQRFPATPYGFGLDPGGFSAKQWSIIAALGLSKKPLGLGL